MPHAQLMPHSNGAAVRGSRLKIATDVTGMLESSKSLSKNGAVCSHWREWRLTALSMGPGPAESAMEPMEKCLSGSSKVKDASPGRHATPAGCDLNVTSLQPGG
jgi:hypothetical protein